MLLVKVILNYQYISMGLTTQLQLRLYAGWLIDSGASHHITHDKSLLLNYRTIERQAINGFSENSVDYAVGEGDIKLSVHINGIDNTITITSLCWMVN